MIKTLRGNVLEIKRGFIVHSCNSLGVFGAGIAAEIKHVYPEAYQVYRNKMAADGLKLGEVTSVSVGDYFGEKFIVNLIGQQNTGKGKQTSYDAIHDGFKVVYQKHQAILAQYGKNLPICFPLIGCGLGGGDWSVVSAIIDSVIPDTVEKNLYLLGD